MEELRGWMRYGGGVLLDFDIRFGDPRQNTFRPPHRLLFRPKHHDCLQHSIKRGRIDIHAFTVNYSIDPVEEGGGPISCIVQLQKRNHVEYNGEAEFIGLGVLSAGHVAQCVFALLDVI